jgi:hypothetical protein
MRARTTAADGFPADTATVEGGASQARPFLPPIVRYETCAYRVAGSQKGSPMSSYVVAIFGILLSASAFLTLRYAVDHFDVPASPRPDQEVEKAAV